MDTSLVFSRVLETLAASPMWGWGVSPSMWVVIGEDPAVVMYAFSVEDVTTLQAFAAHWMSEHPGNVPVGTLALIVDGDEVRDAIITKQDGTMDVVRFFRATGAMARLDPMEMESYYPVEVMREVGASAWP